jgi:hypothetical protein
VLTSAGPSWKEHLEERSSSCGPPATGPPLAAHDHARGRNFESASTPTVEWRSRTGRRGPCLFHSTRCSGRWRECPRSPRTLVRLRSALRPRFPAATPALTSAGGKRLTGIGRAHASRPNRARVLTHGLRVFRGDESTPPSPPGGGVVQTTSAGRDSNEPSARHSYNDGEPPDNVKARRLAVVATSRFPSNQKGMQAAMRDDEPAFAKRRCSPLHGRGVSVPQHRTCRRRQTEQAELAPRTDSSPTREPRWISPANPAAPANARLGPERFALAAAFGSPALAPLRLLDALAIDRARERRRRAGEAFHGNILNYSPNGRPTWAPESGYPSAGRRPIELTSFEKDFLDDATLPPIRRKRTPTGSALAHPPHGRDDTRRSRPRRRVCDSARRVSWLDIAARKRFVDARALSRQLAGTHPCSTRSSSPTTLTSQGGRPTSG